MILFPLVNVGRKRHENMFLSFQDIVSGDDPYVENGKPAPDIYLEAAKRLGMHPSECLVFEDALTGAEAGKSAGCHVVAVPDSRMEREPFVDVADEIIDDMWQFSGKRWGIPLEMRELRR
jgi:beta-phosphoglucomutase-like phosphatase (HAD superfamily)